MYEFGKLIQLARKARGLTQLMLAQRTGMAPVQLCKIEKGRSSPTLETIHRLAEALEISLSELFSDSEFSEAKSKVIAGTVSDGGISRFVCIRSTGAESNYDSVVLEKIFSTEGRTIYLESLLNIPHATKMQFVHSFRTDASGAKMLARCLRTGCFAGLGFSFDLAEMLELKNVRLHIVDLPKEVQSRSYYDTYHHTLSIVLSKSDTAERHVYRIAYELAWAVMFGSAGFKTLHESPSRHRFARIFAAEFLMPEEAMVFLVSQLGIKSNDWTLQLISLLKSKFGVSAEAFALRLESLGLISEELRVKIRNEVRAYYKKNPKSMEPKPCLSSLKIGERRKILEMAVEQGTEE